MADLVGCAGLERGLSEIVSLIADGKIAEYYRRDFEQRVFDAFKRRPAAPSRGGAREAPRGPGRFAPDPVSAAVKNSVLARSGGARRMKEVELARLLLEEPELAHRHGEALAAIHFSDALLDRLRQELLNLAAVGSRLEKEGLRHHLVRSGMADLVERVAAQRSPADFDEGTDIDARFLRAAAQLHDMAELAPERRRAMERFKSDATEEAWLEARRLLGTRSGEE